MEYEGLGFDYKKLIKQKYVIYLACTLLVWGLAYLEATTTFANIDGIHRETKRKTLEVEKLEYFKHLHEDFPEYKKRLEGARQRARKDLPENYNEKEFLRILHEHLGGLKLVSVTLPQKQDIVAVKDAKNIKICPAYVALEGDYFDMLKFMKALETRHFAISKVKLQADKVGYLKISMTIGNFICP